MVKSKARAMTNLVVNVVSPKTSNCQKIKKILMMVKLLLILKKSKTIVLN